MLAYVIAALVVLVAALLAFGIAALLHLQGAAYVIFVIIVLLIGIAAAVTILILHFRSKREKEQGAAEPAAEKSELDLLLNDANRKLRASQQGTKTLDSIPLIYVLGQSGSAKTSTIMQSGLDLELIAGTASHEFEQSPTGILNLWFTGSAALLEVGTSIRGNTSSLGRLVHRTRAKAYRSAFGAGAAPRAAIVCLSMDQLLAPDGGQSLLASARATNADLREISRLLGMPIPVYVIVTKLDRVPHFDKYVHNLSESEVRQVLGISLPGGGVSPGTYADQASRTLATVIDGIVYRLGEFRVEMLDRETDLRNSSGVYEFPREFGKLRKNLSQYLVELCKPSQLSANPYLRGFYFAGIRARVVERAVNAPVAVQAPAPQEAGATQFLDLSRTRTEAAGRAASPAMVATRVPQWTFLARLLPEVILGDRSALAATTQSAPARLFRRILYGSLLVLFAAWLVFLLISYINNASLERRIQDAASTLSRSTNQVAGPPELRALDDLRQAITQLDGYSASGIPLTYRFGLYHGPKLNAAARRVYFDHFRQLLLSPTQQNFLAFMQSLPNAPAASSDFGSYLTAYNPLKGYLITTSNPEKSQPKFLTPVFLQYWIGNRAVDADQQQLASAQIDFYGNELLRQPPYQIAPDAVVVEHARAYLRNFVAEAPIYQAMLSDADRASVSIDFNKTYPGSASYVTDPHVVRGAFTRSGFAFMQNALQHPEKYLQAETWVLGNQSAQALNTSQVSKDLAAEYASDFLKEWHEFLISARVGNCGSLKEAPERLNALSGPASPLLALFYTVSHNTAVADPLIKSTFQPMQFLVNSEDPDRHIGQGNQAYIAALSQLAGQIELVSQNPAAPADLAAFAPVSQQVVTADGAARQAAQNFNVDQQTHTGDITLSLMLAPVQCVKNLAPSPGAPAVGAGQKICAAITPLLGKFPFAPNSPTQATLQEVDTAFQPGTGTLWTMYDAVLNKFLVQQGSQYGPSPTAPQTLNPRFVQYFNRAAHVSSALYPPGQKSASFAFNVRFLPGNGVSSATLQVDGQHVVFGSPSQAFTWNATTAQKASLVVENKEMLPFQGTWSLFQLVRTAHPSPTAGGYRLDYPIENALTVAGHQVGGAASSTRTASFEISGPGADLLIGNGFSGLTCVSPLVK